MTYSTQQGVHGYLGYTIMRQDEPLATIGIKKGYWFMTPMPNLALSVNDVYNILIQFETFKQEVEQ